MGLSDFILTGLTALCLNSTCPDDNSFHNLWYQRYQSLKDELKNDTLIITTLNNGPLSGYTNDSKGIIGTGVAFDIIRILQKEYGFQYKLVSPDDDVFEPPKDNLGGVKNMLLNKNVDVAAAFLPLQYTDVVSYSRSLDTAQWVVLMKRPAESATGSGLLAPFTATVWTLIIISLLVVGPILWLIVLLRAKMCKENYDSVFSLPACMWFVYGALLKQGSTLNPKTDSSRLLFSTWWIFITILTAFYTANLTAFLTLSKFTLPINEAKDIAKKHYKWVTNKGNGIIEELLTSRNLSNGDGKSLYEAVGMPKWEINAEEASILSDYVTRQNYMYIREKTVLETIMYEDYKQKTKENVDEAYRCTYVITNFPVGVFPRAFAFKPGFKYKELFDLTIQHLSESGITEFKQRELLPDTTICPLDLGSKERRLRNADLSMTYMIVGGGLIISTIIFGVELIIHNFNIHGCHKRRPLVVNVTNNNNVLKNNNAQLFPTINYANSYNNNSHYDVKGNFEMPKLFKTPPPSYNTLFNAPAVSTGADVKKKMINGRQYWVINNKQGATSLIPQRAPSALLFQFTN
nr:ionotropic receptor 76b [Pachyrhinus yasumatsui]